jgi:serine/threonine protein kinase
VAVVDQQSGRASGGDSAASDAQMIEAARGDVEGAAKPSGEAPVDADVAGHLPDGSPPDSFTGYKILRKIHRGGQGVVYQAIQESTDRKVAIKVMKEGPFAGPADKARFDREVRVLSQLKNPSIVTIHDTGSAAGVQYLVMDFVSGQPLDVYMASSQRSIGETLELFEKVCEAVNAAHLRGIIHRDLKPGNIRVDAEG